MTNDISNRLQHLLDDRHNHATALQLIDDKLSQVERLLGWTIVAPKKRGRPPKSAVKGNGEAVENGVNRQPVTLADHLEVVIRNAGKPQKIADLLSGVEKSDYKSKSKDLRPIASLALIKDQRFRRVARGVYDIR